jgi:hypothetical protein
MATRIGRATEDCRKDKKIYKIKKKKSYDLNTNRN